MPIISDPSSYTLIDSYLAALGRDTLGRPEEYEVFIVDRSLGAVITAPPWSALSWNRRLSDFSECSITIPMADGGLDCCDSVGGLKPWRFGLRVERDGKTVHTGPVQTISRAEGSTDIVVTARDFMAWMTKRIQRFDRPDSARTATQRYARNIFAQLITDAFVADDVPLDNIVQVLAGLGPSLTRDYTAGRLQRCYELAQELTRQGIDYTVVGFDLIFGDFAGLATIGTFTEEAFQKTPAAALDGLAQANQIYVTGGVSPNISGFNFGFYSLVDALDGVLEEVYVELENTADTAGIPELNASAQAQWNNRHIAPPTLSNAVLTPEAPVPIEALIPGSFVIVDALDSCLWAAAVLRLTAIDVSVSVDAGAMVESVGITLQSDMTAV